MGALVTAGGLAVLRLSTAQVRLVNAALALLEAEAEDQLPPPDPDVLERTRAKVHAGMEAAGIAP